jgi:threonyl-tRNA synthetase
VNINLKKYDEQLCLLDVLKDIKFPKLNNVLACAINGTVFDLRDTIELVVSSLSSRSKADISASVDFTDVSCEGLTSNDPRGLEVLRHDTAHILAEAIGNLYKNAQITIGPIIDDGFYYDIYMPDYAISTDDLLSIENEMRKIIDKNADISRSVLKSDKAIDFFEKIGETFKAKIITDLAVDEVSLYTQDEFTDLCKGPHAMTTGVEKHFKLTHVSGAYWRGDQNNESLQRIYGTCWGTKQALQEHIDLLDRLHRIDHRNLGKRMDLFHIQQEATGSVFWHARGWTLYKIIENYMRDKIASTYSEVNTPQLIDKVLWEKSGHWEHFRHNMFVCEAGNATYALKPMNCPAHTQIFRQGVKSYRDLPLRMFEFGSCHRNEPSGALHGIMRVRGFVQDDGHIFCSEEHIERETKDFCAMLLEVYSDFGFHDVCVKLAGKPENAAGDDETWTKAEALLASGAEKAGLEFKYNPGEGAFYGPKLEFVIRDAVKREWQCGTLQLDFLMCKRLNVSYTKQDGTKDYPIMLHRAILGSLQRFIGMLLEHHEGRLPLWLSPIQVAVIGLNDKETVTTYIKEFEKKLKEMKVRVHIDERQEKMGYKLRDLVFEQMIPCIVVIGEREIAEDMVSVRIVEKSFQMKKEEFFQFILAQSDKKSDIYEYSSVV